MKLLIKITFFTILTLSGVLASKIKYDIELLVKKIKITHSVKEKNLLLKELDEKLEDNFVNTQQTINKNIKLFKFI
ncbi:MAG: hypothetical protein ACNI28_01765 [Arcobacter sp.]|uniref:hypothetical protein n=1 Tax=Arcobacter sp. TaxID=1872629 RepID=UPI003AFFCF61